MVFDKHKTRFIVLMFSNQRKEQKMVQESDLRHEIMTSQEVMRLLRISRHSLMKGINGGEIKCFRFAGQMRFLRSDVQGIFAGKKSTNRVGK